MRQGESVTCKRDFTMSRILLTNRMPSYPSQLDSRKRGRRSTGNIVVVSRENIMSDSSTVCRVCNLKFRSKPIGRSVPIYVNELTLWHLLTDSSEGYICGVNLKRALVRTVGSVIDSASRTADTHRVPHDRAFLGFASVVCTCCSSCGACIRI